MSILIVCARGEDSASLGLANLSLPGATVVSALPQDSVLTDLVVAIHRADEREAAARFDEWAWRAGLPALGVRLGESGALFGPLSLPGRVGCGSCARARIVAAEASAGCVGELPRELAATVPPGAGAVLAGELAAVMGAPPAASRLVDHVLAWDAPTDRSSLHRVVPLPTCALCGGAATLPPSEAPPARLSADDAPESVIEALAGFFDTRTGIVSRIALALSGETQSDLPIVATVSPPYAIDEDGALRRLPVGWGKGLTVSGAILSAVGEAIERYAASLPDPARLVWARPGELDGAVLDPRELSLYTEAQYQRLDFPYRRFDPEVSHPWIAGRWLGGDTRVWVPAVFAFLHSRIRPENEVYQGTSNGLAAAADLQDAALRATMELVERDAFMAAWLTGCAGRRVDLNDGLDPSLRHVLAGVEALGATIELYLLPTSACGTTAMCLALGDGRSYPGATIGLGADLDPLVAVRQAILETAQTGAHLRRLMRSGRLAAPDDPSGVHELIQHAAYYFPADRAAAFDRLRDGTSPIRMAELIGGAPRSLADCAAALGAAQVRVALVDVTSPDVATGPFRVVRAVSPDLQSLSYGHGFDHPPVPRVLARGVGAGAPPIHPIW